MVMLYNQLILCHPLLLWPSGCFPTSQLFASGGQSIGASATASVLQLNIQLISFRIDWFDLLTVQGDSQESSPAPQFERIYSLVLSLLYVPTLTSKHDYWKNQSCPALCDPMDWSMPGFPIHHQLPELSQTHAYWISDAIQPSHPLSSPYPPTWYFPASGSFLISQLFISGGQILEFQLQHQSFQWRTHDCSPLGWTGCISLQSKGFSRVFSNTTI